MTLIPLNEQALAALTRGPDQLVGVTDSAGKVVGFFAPVGVEHADQYAAAAHFYPTRDVRPAAADRRYTGEEARAFLQSLETQGL